MEAIEIIERIPIPSSTKEIMFYILLIYTAFKLLLEITKLYWETVKVFPKSTKKQSKSFILPFQEFIFGTLGAFLFILLIQKLIIGYILASMFIGFSVALSLPNQYANPLFCSILGFLSMPLLIKLLFQ